MAGPPMLDKDTAISAVANLWSLAWAGVAMLLTGAIFYLEIQNVSFDKAREVYVTNLALEKQMLWLFGAAMIATGLAIMPLYQRDPHDVGRVSSDE
ncbi:MAG TPA: hypothetical protein VEI97_16625 [bacterium]|nr:hypothetical protein [bacterium]